MSMSVNPQSDAGTNGHSAVGDVLYAMSDEQILEMEPEIAGGSGRDQKFC